jgi:predicted amino acid dehydrogenase
MSTHNAIRPEDILPDGVDSTAIHGKIVRKGTIAAFLANTEILEHPNSTKQQKQEAIEAMKELAPAVIAVGLHRHVVFKNNEIEQILIDAEE